MGIIKLHRRTGILAVWVVSLLLLATGPLQADITSGLEAHYAFENNVNDSTANHRNGTVQGSALTYINGPVGKAVYFNGSGSNWVSCGTWNPSAATGDLSISLWCRWDGYVNYEWYDPVCKRDSWGTANMMWQLEQNVGSSNISIGNKFMFVNGTLPTTTAGAGLSTNNWEHRVFTFDHTSGTVTMYRNGTLLGSYTHSLGTKTNATVRIGAAHSGTNPENFWNGGIDDLRIYNRVLTAQDITELYVLAALNLPPNVDAGPNQMVRFDQNLSATLNGTITDDDPDNLGEIGVDYGTVQWSCPANAAVIFADSSDPHTTVTFPRDGYYLLQLYAQDDVGNQASDTVVMNVLVPAQFENRVVDMVSQMTVSEKIQELDADNSNGVPRLALPAYNYWNEGLHGVATSGLATVFPQCIGMGAMWDDALLYEIFTAVSDEARVKANTINEGLTYWTPTINLARDPRWGRNQETYGEDPYHLSRMAVAVARGLQGSDPNYLKTVSTPKHFIANNTETGRHTTSSDVDMRNLREFYMPAFKAAITEANAFSVMSAYNALNGIPCSANSWLLMDVLRGEWGFRGYVVSDCGAISDIYSGHHYAATHPEASAMALNAGTDLNCGDSYQNHLQTAYNQGLVTEDTITHSVENVLRARFKLGEFDPPSLVSYTSIPASVLDSNEHRNLSLLAAKKSMVLLKNEGALPLDINSIQSIAVIGPTANQCILGGYTGSAPYCISPLTGIQQKVSGQGITVNYMQGCTISGTGGPIPTQYLKPSAGSDQNGLTGSYYNNMTLSGTPVLTRLDSQVDFDWGTGSPGGGVNSDGFSVRWSGVLKVPATRTYQLGARTDDGFRLYLDGALITQDWTDHAARTVTASVVLTAGQDCNIVLEYYENGGNAVAQLVWDYVSTFTDVANLAAASDVAIVFVGTDSSVASEENDMDQYQMPGLQESMIQAIYAANPNTVVVLINGNPIGFEWTADNVPAILEAWYAGQSQGTAIADCLFGDYNPGGKLSQTFYKSQSQLPDLFDYDIINGGRTYQYFEGDVLYPFGHGLSYTQFAYSNLTVEPNVLSAQDTVTIEFDVQNTGPVLGDEVAQVYFHDAQASVKVPIKQLRGFKRVTLDTGQSQHLRFDIPVSQLGFYDVNQHTFVVEGGIFDVFAASSSQDIRLQGDFVVRPPLDVDGSGLIDAEDLRRVISEWLSADCYTANMCSGADLDGSGFVDFIDLAMLSLHWMEYH